MLNVVVVFCVTSILTLFLFFLKLCILVVFLSFKYEIVTALLVIVAFVELLVELFVVFVLVVFVLVGLVLVVLVLVVLLRMLGMLSRSMVSWEGRAVDASKGSAGVAA